MKHDDRIVLRGTDLSVSRLCLGGNRLGGELDQEKSFALLDGWLDAGGNFIDSAHVYANWLPDVERSCSEKTLGRWLKARRPKNVVIATKIGMSPPGAQPGLGRANLTKEIDEALAYLGVDTIDLLYLHRDDPSLPVEDLLQSVETFRTEGKLRFYACSNWAPARIQAAADAAKKHGWAGFVAHQPEWSLAQRNAGSASAGLEAMDDALLAYHMKSGLPVICYSAQAKGYFDKVAEGRADDALMRSYDNAHNRAIAGHLSSIAKAHDATPTQVMLRFMLSAPFQAIPVVGCKTRAQIDASLAALDIDLSASEAQTLRTAAGW